MLSINVPLSSLVCRPCRHDVTRVLANPAYVPRWRKSKGQSNNSHCYVRNCENLTFTHSTLGSAEELKCAFESKGIEINTECIPTPTPLCKYHYYAVYNIQQPRYKHCVTCGTRLGKENHRPCPQPQTIQLHLQEQTGFEGEILGSDRVCMTCYRSHLVILKGSHHISNDEELKALVKTFTQQPPSIECIVSNEDIIAAAMNKTLITVGKMLLENQALLLPTIHSTFNKHAKDLVMVKGLQEPQELQTISSRWILSELTVNFQHHIAYSCKVRKHGTLVYRPTSDVLGLLSEAKKMLEKYTVTAFKLVHKLM